MSVTCIPTTTPLLVWIATLAIAAGCGASSAEVRVARTSGYDTEFARVYSEALEVVRELYPAFTEDPTTGLIKTAWHPLRVSTSAERERLTQRRDLAGLAPGQTGEPMRYYVRFNVRVLGGKPWRVRVTGRAAEWDVGSVPAELSGGNEPHWLAGRVQALEVAIHRRLESYAVSLPAAAEPPPEPPSAPAAGSGELARYRDLPPAAAQAVVQALLAARSRDLPALGEVMDASFTWSLGAPPSARDALMMWQADGTVLGKLAGALAAGCRQDEPSARVLCPAAYQSDPGYRGYHAAFAQVADGSWKMVALLPGE